MGALCEFHIDVPVTNFNSTSTLDEVTEYFWGITIFKATQLLSKAAIKGVRNHSHDHIKVDLDQDRRRQGIEMEKLNRLGDTIFDTPSPGVVADQQFHRHLKVIGDQKSRLLPAVATDNDLPYFAFITAEFNCRFVNHRLRILTLVVGDGDPFPGLKFLCLQNKFMAPPPEGDEPDFLSVEFREIFVSGQFRVKDECRFHRLFDTLPEGQESEITNAIEKVLARYKDKGVAIYFSGTPAVISTLQKSIMHDMSIMIPLSFLLIVLFLVVLFRRVSGLVYPLIVVSLSLLASLGAMAVLGLPITLVSQILPSFLLVVGIGDSVHIMTIFYRRYRDTGDKHRAIVEAIRFAGLPVLMTSVTTACGVLSFIWADVATVAQLGYITPIGVMLALAYTVVLLPALIAVFPVKQPTPLPENTIPFADRIFTWIARVTTQRAVLVSTISGIIVACALAGAMSVRFSHNALNWFPEDSEIRIATQLLDSLNGGSVMLEAIVDTGRDNGLQEPDTLQKFARATAELPGITVNKIKASKAWSLADVLKETNRALHEDQDTAYRVPDSRELIAQELLLFEGSGSDDLEDFTDINYRIGRISLLAPFADAILYKDYVDTIKAYLQNLFPDATITLTGKIPLFVQLIKNVVTSLAKSFVFALLVITLIMIVMVGRVRIGLLSMVANVVPIIGVLGLMGIKHIPLDLSTMLIGSLVLGLVVDDTIHFLHHFRRAYEECNDVEQAVRMTLFSTGRAMVITSCVLAGGFFIYTAAYLESNVRYGLLSGCAVIFALAADFYLVPALLSIAYGKRQNQSCPREL